MTPPYGRLLLFPVLLVLLAGCGPAGTFGVRKGEPAPALALEDLHGNQVNLADFQGRPLLINFWATWCPPCRAEMPELQAVYAAQPEDGLVILGVDALYQDSLDDVTQFVAQQKLTFPVLLDRDGATAVAYRVATLPTSVFVDRQGKIHLVQVGPVTRQFVESVLREMR